jgi:hypothetical protein
MRYYKRHPEMMNKWNREHPEYRHIRYLKNRDKELGQAVEYQHSHGKEVALYRKKYRDNLRKKAIEALGGKCANPYNLPHPDWCNDIRCLQIDHINGGGTKELNLISRPSFLHSIIKGERKDVQLLCANCNWIKKCNNMEVTR